MARMTLGRRTRLLALAFTLAILGAGGGAAGAESRLEALGRLQEAAEAAIKAEDLGAAEARLAEADRLFPDHPSILARLATVRALRGDAAGAVASLGAYARLGLLLNMQRPERAALTSRPDFTPVAETFADNAAAKGRLAWTLAVDAAAPMEGAAFDPGTGRIFISLVGGRGILVGDEAGGFKPFSPPTTGAGAGLGAIFGMAYDKDRDVLWAAEASGEDIPGSSGPARTAILRIDGRSGAILSRHALPEDGVRRQLGDVLLGPGGSVYATDSVAGGLYRLEPGAPAPGRIAASADWGSPQGMAWLPGGDLLVADYATGLHRVEPGGGAVFAVAAPPGVSLIGVDGLVRVGERLIATQNGVQPMRILALTLAPDGSRVTGVDVLLAAQPQADDIALGAAAGTRFVFSARSGWAGFDAKGDAVGAPITPLLAAIDLP